MTPRTSSRGPESGGWFDTWNKDNDYASPAETTASRDWFTGSKLRLGEGGNGPRLGGYVPDEPVDLSGYDDSGARVRSPDAEARLAKEMAALNASDRQKQSALVKFAAPRSTATNFGFSDGLDAKDIRAGFASTSGAQSRDAATLKLAAQDFATRAVQAFDRGDKAQGDKYLGYASEYYKASGQAQQAANNFGAAAYKFQLPSAAPGATGFHLRAPDFINFQIDAYVFSVSGTFTRDGNSFVGGGFNLGIPNPLALSASTTVGWLNSASVEPGQTNKFAGGYSGGATAVYVGVGGGIVYSPGAGTATVIGIGAGYSAGTAFRGA